MSNKIKKNLIDILHSAEEIMEFVGKMDFVDYAQSKVTQRAVERNFEIIGEALNRIRKIDEDSMALITEYYRIIGFRNILIHGYDTVDEMIVWDAVENHLPLLKTEVESLLSRFQEAAKISLRYPKSSFNLNVSNFLCNSAFIFTRL